MDNKNFDFLFDENGVEEKVIEENILGEKALEEVFDEKIRKNIKCSFDDIEFNEELKLKIKEKALKDKTFKEKLNEFLNYEVTIPIGKMGVIAALLALIPTTFTIYEGKKIIDNNIEIKNEEMFLRGKGTSGY